jgi:hypothetical protein
MSASSPHGTASFTSPRLRGEVDLATSAFTRVSDAPWRGRVRGAIRALRLSKRPLIRLAASLLATFSPFSPQAGRRKEEATP